MVNSTSAALIKTFGALGGAIIVESLVEQANTERGKRLAATPKFAESLHEADRLLDETEAMVDLIKRRPDFDLAPSEDVTLLLTKATKGGALTGAELRSFLPTLISAEKVSLLFSIEGINEDHPLWTPISAPLGLAGLIEDSIDQDGAVRPDATPEIERLAKIVTGLKNSIRAKAESMLKDESINAMLQESYVTLRDDRFVLPVKSEHKSHIKGIVHGASNTGQTFYIEPSVLVESNNRLREAETELEIEIHRLLVSLTAMVGDEKEEILAAMEALAKLDLIYARAVLSIKLYANRPTFGGTVKLNNIANPIMLLEKKPVVIKSDLVIPDGVKALVISGPNAGGKTVAMTAIGLSALMARMGLFVCADVGSKIPFYSEVFADIGDSQSIHDGLSTFSAHLTALKTILNNVTKGGLVLLDELMVSTDPREGAALAVAVLDRLVETGTHVVVTTHFHDIKVLAQSERGYYNLSMEFDTLHGTPTYRVVPGAPGASSALALAERIGIDPKIIGMAKSRLEGSDERIEVALGDLREQKTLLMRERREAEKLKEEAKKEADEAKSTLAKINEEKDELKRNAKRKLSNDLADARRMISGFIEEARISKKDVKKLSGIRENLESVAADVREAVAPVERVPRDQLEFGDRVYIIPLQKNGFLLATPSTGKVDVDVGGLRVAVNINELIGIAKRDRDSGVTTHTTSLRHQVYQKPTRRSMGATSKIDIRGLRADEAIDVLEKHLDDIIVGNEETLLVIHGMGTGALKIAVREYLETSSYVSGYNDAEPSQGGAGVTVATLRK